MQTVCNTYWDAGKGNLTAQYTRKPFGGRALIRPELRWGAYNAPANPLSGGGWLPLPKNPIPRSRPFRPRLSYLHSKISSDAVAISYRKQIARQHLCRKNFGVVEPVKNCAVS